MMSSAAEKYKHLAMKRHHESGAAYTRRSFWPPVGEHSPEAPCVSVMYSFDLDGARCDNVTVLQVYDPSCDHYIHPDDWVFDAGAFRAYIDEEDVPGILLARDEITRAQREMFGGRGE